MVKSFREIVEEKSPGQAGIDAARQDEVFAKHKITFEPGSKNGKYNVLFKGKVVAKDLSSADAREKAAKLVKYGESES